MDDGSQSTTGGRTEDPNEMHRPTGTTTTGIAMNGVGDGSVEVGEGAVGVGSGLIADGESSNGGGGGFHGVGGAPHGDGGAPNGVGGGSTRDGEGSTEDGSATRSGTTNDSSNENAFYETEVFDEQSPSLDTTQSTWIPGFPVDSQNFLMVMPPHSSIETRLAKQCDDFWCQHSPSVTPLICESITYKPFGYLTINQTIETVSFGSFRGESSQSGDADDEDSDPIEPVDLSGRFVGNRPRRIVSRPANSSPVGDFRAPPRNFDLSPILSSSAESVADSRAAHARRPRVEDDTLESSSPFHSFRSNGSYANLTIVRPPFLERPYFSYWLPVIFPPREEFEETAEAPNIRPTNSPLQQDPPFNISDAQLSDISAHANQEASGLANVFPSSTFERRTHPAQDGVPYYLSESQILRHSSSCSSGSEGAAPKRKVSPSESAPETADLEPTAKRAATTRDSDNNDPNVPGTSGSQNISHWNRMAILESQRRQQHAPSRNIQTVSSNLLRTDIAAVFPIGHNKPIEVHDGETEPLEETPGLSVYPARSAWVEMWSMFGLMRKASDDLYGDDRDFHKFMCQQEILYSSMLRHADRVNKTGLRFLKPEDHEVLWSVTPLPLDQHNSRLSQLRYTDTYVMREFFDFYRDFSFYMTQDNREEIIAEYRRFCDSVIERDSVDLFDKKKIDLSHLAERTGAQEEDFLEPALRNCPVDFESFLKQTSNYERFVELIGNCHLDAAVLISELDRIPTPGYTLPQGRLLRRLVLNVAKYFKYLPLSGLWIVELPLDAAEFYEFIPFDPMGERFTH